MPSLLLTGFQPWDGLSTNPSWEHVKRYRAPLDVDWTVQRLELPVDWQEAPAVLDRAVEEAKPLRAVLLTGVARGASEIRIEFFAQNSRNLQLPDATGRPPESGIVVPDGPPTYCATLPVHEIVDAWHDEGIRGEISLDAGAYLCNAVFYHLMHRFAEDRYQPMIGFLHVPEEGVLPVAEVQRALSLAISVIMQAPEPVAEVLS